MLFVISQEQAEAAFGSSADSPDSARSRVSLALTVSSAPRWWIIPLPSSDSTIGRCRQVVKGIDDCSVQVEIAADLAMLFIQLFF
jgi:hypothetical protein